MTTNEELIKLLKNDDTEALDKIYINYASWDKDINFSFVYENIKDDNNPNIHNFIGRMYHYGIDVEKNYSKTLEYYQLSADQGNPYA